MKAEKNKYILVQKEEDIKDKNISRKCKEIGIKPKVNEILLYRINKFLEIANYKDDYQIIYEKGK